MTRLLMRSIRSIIIGSFFAFIIWLFVAISSIAMVLFEQNGITGEQVLIAFHPRLKMVIFAFCIFFILSFIGGPKKRNPH